MFGEIERGQTLANTAGLTGCQSAPRVGTHVGAERQTNTKHRAFTIF